jgi:hypothetical protein
VTVELVIALPPLLGAVHATRAPPTIAAAVTPVGVPGAVVVVGVTAFDDADSVPDPPALAACTLKVYAVPPVRPRTVVVSAGGAPESVTAFAVCAVAPM